MIFPKLFNHGNLKSLKVSDGKLIMEGTYGKEEFEGGGGSLPEGGSTGQVLTKTSSASEWATPKYVPDGGTAGQALKKFGDSDQQTYWADCFEVPTNGSIGQVLKRYGTEDDEYAWADPLAVKTNSCIMSMDAYYPKGDYTVGTNIYLDRGGVPLSEGSIAKVSIDVNGFNGKMFTIEIVGVPDSNNEISFSGLSYVVQDNNSANHLCEISGVIGNNAGGTSCTIKSLTSKAIAVTVES